MTGARTSGALLAVGRGSSPPPVTQQGSTTMTETETTDTPPGGWLPPFFHTENDMEQVMVVTDRSILSTNTERRKVAEHVLDELLFMYRGLIRPRWHGVQYHEPDLCVFVQQNAERVFQCALMNWEIGHRYAEIVLNGERYGVLEHQFITSDTQTLCEQEFASAQLGAITTMLGRFYECNQPAGVLVDWKDEHVQLDTTILGLQHSLEDLPLNNLPPKVGGIAYSVISTRADDTEGVAVWQNEPGVYEWYRRNHGTVKRQGAGAAAAAIWYELGLPSPPPEPPPATANDKPF